MERGGQRGGEGGGELTFKAMAPWMQPSIGGIVSLHLAKILLRVWSFAMSQGGAATTAPAAPRSLMKLIASSLWAPRRPSRIRYRAPFETIHRAILRPRPPRPPVITYVAFGRNDQEGFKLGTIYFHQLFSVLINTPQLSGERGDAYSNNILIPYLNNRLPHTLPTLQIPKRLLHPLPPKKP